jgi:hypothetical protein
MEINPTNRGRVLGAQLTTVDIVAPSLRLQPRSTLIYMDLFRNTVYYVLCKGKGTLQYMMRESGSGGVSSTAQSVGVPASAEPSQPLSLTGSALRRRSVVNRRL